MHVTNRCAIIIKIHNLALQAISIVRAVVSLVHFAIYHLKILSTHSEVSSVSVMAVSKAISSIRFARQFPQVGEVDRDCMEGPGSTISDDSRFAPEDGILPPVIPNGSVVVPSIKFDMTLLK